MYVHWIRGQATWEDRDAVCLCREKICAVKAQLELKVFGTVGNTHTHIHTKQNKQTKKMFKNMLTAKGGLEKTQLLIYSKPNADMNKQFTALINIYILILSAMKQTTHTAQEVILEKTGTFKVKKRKI